MATRHRTTRRPARATLTAHISAKVRAGVLRSEARSAPGLTAEWMRDRAQTLDPQPPAPATSLYEEIARSRDEYDALPAAERAEIDQWVGQHFAPQGQAR